MKEIDIRIEKRKEIGANIVTRAFSFQSLLNLPNDEELMGKMRYVWEGGDGGEGKIKDIKNSLSRVYVICFLTRHEIFL